MATGEESEAGSAQCVAVVCEYPEEDDLLMLKKEPAHEHAAAKRWLHHAVPGLVGCEQIFPANPSAGAAGGRWSQRASAPGGTEQEPVFAVGEHQQVRSQASQPCRGEQLGPPRQGACSARGQKFSLFAGDAGGYNSPPITRRRPAPVPRELPPNETSRRLWEEWNEPLNPSGSSSPVVVPEIACLVLSVLWNPY
ncbi:hypothetical protein TARUN_9008 [Trichoderma arundinaceum]|uniref:Uncharacterized protein n=1 Tax=Trichoderma arundinaceum TaxID=490622 RepID=A0A395NC12_TRIAR|nr:hypothetical protein TARUN_9008 [Trichoderma arundinaceum]